MEESRSRINTLLQKALEQADRPGEGDEEPIVMLDPNPPRGKSEFLYHLVLFITILCFSSLKRRRRGISVERETNG